MKEYKPIFICLIKFFSVYLILIGFYYLYLRYYQIHLQTCDPYTEIVAKQSASFLSWFSVNSDAIHNIKTDNYMLFFINKKLTSIINEGCNALSVIILYISFIITFSSTLKKTVLYLLITYIIIYCVNISRIAFINYVFYYYPEYGNETHDYIFPSIIYGLIIILWLGWIKYFIFRKKK